MDMSLVAAALMSRAAATQSQIATSVLKSNMDSEKSSVLTLLGAGQPNTASQANLGAGISFVLNRQRVIASVAIQADHH